MKIALVDTIGINWTKMKYRSAIKSFDERMADLRSCKEKHGYLHVKKNEDTSLYLYCATVRWPQNNPGKASIKITDDRITTLEKLEFDWSFAVQKTNITKTVD